MTFPLTLRNRFIKAATNEGMSPNGVPSRQLVQFHAAMAAGGVGLTTVAYCAVSADGCTLPNQIRLDRSVLPHLRVLWLPPAPACHPAAWLWA